METIHKSPIRNYGELVNSYTELVAEYLKYACEVHNGHAYKIRRKELEETLIQMGNAIRSMEGRDQEPRYYVISFNKAMYKIDLNKTVYIHSEARKVVFVQASGCSFTTYAKLDDIWEDVQGLANCFCRISKSYIVNIFYVDSLDGSGVHVGNQIFSTTRKYFNRELGRNFIQQYLCAGSGC